MKSLIYRLSKSKFFSVLLLLSVLFVSGCDDIKPHHALPKGAVVLALGDSLTYGYGALTEQSYPERLAAATGWRVINAGINGNTSSEALARLPDLLDTYKPDLTIVSIGGNDFLQRLPEGDTRQNIREIIATIRSHSDSEILLIAIPHYSISAALGRPKDHPMYAEIAESEHIALLSDAWAEILAERSLRSDQVHPNGDGYGQFNDKLSEFLRQQGWLAE